MITDTLQASLANYESYAKALVSLRPIEGAADFRSYMKAANKTDLANGYCDATDSGDEYLRSVYFSALMVRFWHKVIDAIKENPTLRLDPTDYVSWLSGSILLACDPKARTWRKADGKCGNFETALNQTFETRFRRQAYRDSNLKRNQGKAFMLSLDQPLDEEGRSVLGDVIADPDARVDDTGSASYIIQECIDKNLLVEAIILDNIVHKDVFREERETAEGIDSDGNKVAYTRHKASFWMFRLVKELGALDDEAYTRYFSSAYKKVSVPAFREALKAISKSNSQKRKKMVAAALNDLKPMAMGWAGR